MGKRGRKGTTHICGDAPCPNDDNFVHAFYYGCVPQDFQDKTGTSATYEQTEASDGKYRWNGGCDAS